MKANLLCPGPSLRSWVDAELYSAEAIVGVNRAVLRVPCTDWVFLDSNVYQQFRPENPCAIWSNENTIHNCKGMAGHHHWHPVESLFDRFPQRLQIVEDSFASWCMYSATSALVVCAALGATQIEVYGADWTDEPDFDGVRMEECRRDKERWESEIPLWKAIVADLAKRGITVNRNVFK